MKLIDYIKDKLVNIVLELISLIVITILLILFSCNTVLIIMVIGILGTLFITLLFSEYLKKRKFYNNFTNILYSLEPKYLISEMVINSNFLEGNLLLQYLYIINKSMLENITFYQNNNTDFRDYIELWCHEIKTPIATGKLLIENNQNKITNSINEEFNKIDNFVNQVLYYARSSNVNDDYIINEVDLKTIIDKIILQNKKYMLEKKIKLEVTVNDLVYSDSKWLEFIINQIIANSIKYISSNPKIIIKTIKNKDNIQLVIEDNGIGIIEGEINKVFNKGFTGSNGRKKYNSTGMGLYLCKKLCNKLDHKIELSSVLNKKTIVTITFPTSSMIEGIK